MNTVNLSEKKSEIASTLEAILTAKQILEDLETGKIIYVSSSDEVKIRLSQAIQKLDQAFDRLTVEI